MNDKISITAGFGKAKNALAIAELLSRKGFEITSIIVINPLSVSRIRKEVNAKGKWFIKNGIKKIFSFGKKKSLLNDFLLENKVELRSLKKWAKLNNVNYILANNINSVEVIKQLEKEKPGWLIYGGGGIIKKNLISTMRGNILNAHSGPMPEIRGMNAIEWTYLLNYNPSITLHLIDDGIDTGQILFKREVYIEKSDTIEIIRDKAVIVGIKSIIEFFENRDSYLIGIKTLSNASKYRQCFVLSPLLRDHLNKKLQLYAK